MAEDQSGSTTPTEPRGSSADGSARRAGRAADRQRCPARLLGRRSTASASLVEFGRPATFSSCFPAIAIREQRPGGVDLLEEPRCSCSSPDRGRGRDGRRCRCSRRMSGSAVMDVSCGLRDPPRSAARRPRRWACPADRRVIGCCNRAWPATDERRYWSAFCLGGVDRGGEVAGGERRAAPCPSASTAPCGPAPAGSRGRAASLRRRGSCPGCRRCRRRSSRRVRPSSSRTGSRIVSTRPVRPVHDGVRRIVRRARPSGCT